MFDEVQITGEVSYSYDVIAFCENQLTCVERDETSEALVGLEKKWNLGLKKYLPEV